MIHKRVLKVRAISTPFGVAPEISVPAGINIGVLSIADKEAIVECTLSDLVAHPSLLKSVKGEQMQYDSPQGRISASLWVLDDHELDASKKLAWFDSPNGRKIAPYMRKEKFRAGRYRLILDEG